MSERMNASEPVAILPVGTGLLRREPRPRPNVAQYAFRITREQLPWLNDALYLGVQYADPEDRPAAEAFRDDLRAQLHWSVGEATS